MMLTLALLLSAIAYSAFYASAPGRQSQAVGPVRPLFGAGAVLTVAAFALSVVATRSAVGPTLVLTVMMATASVLAMIGPFLLPDAGGTARPRSSPADGADSSPQRPASRPARLPSTSDQ